MAKDDKKSKKAGKKEKRKAYEKTLRKLQVELCHLQAWVKHKGLRVIIIFEGRDGAGKGGTIRAITERVSPRVFRVVALPAPSDREKSQMYMQRYMNHFPAAGEVVIFDRSWYNRAGVEHVMGFCTEEQYRRFLENAPEIERYITAGNIILIKYWLEVSNDEQAKRFEARIEDLELRLKLLEARVRAGLPQARAPQREAARLSRVARRSRPRPRCPGCLLELPPGRRGDACVWCGFRFEAVRPVYLKG